jgi:hypothetical protein
LAKGAEGIYNGENIIFSTNDAEQLNIYILKKSGHKTLHAQQKLT